MFIVMEYCKDGELQALIEQGRCSERCAQHCMAQLADGLKALRSAKIVHVGVLCDGGVEMRVW